MASFHEHCQDCRRELGEPFEQVHLWLDELFATMGPGHRTERHHQEGAEEVRRKWGDKAAKAAEVHIRKDWWGEFPTKAEVEQWMILH